METFFHRWDIAKIYLVVGAGFLVLTGSFYFFGFRPVTERLDSEHSDKIEHFLQSGTWLLESALDRHISLVKQSASRTAIRKKQAAYLRGDLNLSDLIAFSAPKLNDARKADEDIVGITRFDPAGKRLYGVGLRVSDEVAGRCGFPNLYKIKRVNPIWIGGKRRLVYCSPITDKGHTSEIVGFDVVILEEFPLQAIIDVGDASNIDIMYLFVSEEGQDILFKPGFAEGFPSESDLKRHLTSGAKMPGFITRSQPISGSQWRVHAVVNEELFFADIREHMLVLASVVFVVMMVIFICTVLVLRPIIRTLLKGAELLKMSHRDGLTGLYNHAYMQVRLDEQVALSQRTENALSVIMVDVDHFKQVNDQYGHQAGDEVLRQIAIAIKDSLRTADLASRYGGEEFMLILSSTDRKGALICAERLRHKVERKVVHVHSADIRVTISLGLACYTGQNHKLGRQEIVRAADMALYESKHSGRNRTTVADSLCQESDDKEIVSPAA